MEKKIKPMSDHQMKNMLFNSATPPQPATVEEAARHVWDLLGGDYYNLFPEGDEMGMIMYCRDLLRETVLDRYAQQPEPNPENENIWQWLCARIHPLKDRGDYKFWIKQAFEMWSEKQPEPMGGKTADEILDDYGVRIHGSMRWRALDAMEAYRFQPQWRETAKELPKEDGVYLVAMRNKNKSDGIFLVDVAVFNSERVWTERYNSWEEITHWQPLPEKPTTK